MKTKEAMQQLALMGFTCDEEPIYTKGTKDADPDLKYREFIKKYGYPKTKEQAKALIEKAKKEGIDPDYIKGMERGLNTWDADPHQFEYKVVVTYGKGINGGPLADPEKIVYADSDEEAKKMALKYTENWKLKENPVAKIVSKKKLTNDADTVLEYNAEIQRLTRKAEQLRKMGQGKSAIEVEKQIEKLGKELRDYSRDDDATEHGSIEEYGQNKETESMPLEKDPTLAQDEYKPNPKVIRILEDLRAHKLSPEAADKMLVQAGVPYVMAGLMVRKPEQYIPVNDEDKFGTVMKEFYEGKLKSSSGEKVTDPQQAKAIAYSETKDSALEELELRLAQLQHQRNVDESVGGYKSDSRIDKQIEQLKKQIKELKEKKTVNDSMEILKLMGIQ